MISWAKIIALEEQLNGDREAPWLEKVTLKLHFPGWWQVGCHPLPGRFRTLMYPPLLPPEGMALLTTQDSAVTESTGASFESEIS